MGFYLNLEEYQKKILFQKVNDSNSFIGVKLKAIEFLLSFWKGNKELHPPYMYVDDKDLHRVFLVNQDGKNIISFSFDFTVDIKKENDEYYISSLKYLKMPQRITLLHVSEAISILNQYQLDCDNIKDKSINALYYNISLDEYVHSESILLFERVAFSEPSYFRYDNTIVGSDDDLHPKQHFDVNYSSLFTYKLGLNKHVVLQEITDMIHKKKYCPRLFLSKDMIPIRLLEKKKNLSQKRRSKTHKKKH